MTSGAVPPTIGAGEPWQPAAILETLPVAVYATDAAGWITWYNEAAAALWGRRPEPGAARYCGAWRLYAADGSALDPERSPLALALGGAAPQPADLLVERPDGSRVAVSLRPQVTRDAAGRALSGSAAMLARDIAANRAAEIAARRLAAIVESSDDAIIAKDLDGIITDFNLGAERLFGYSADEMIGRPVTVLIPPDRLDEEPEILNRIRRGERIDHYETIRRRKDGSPVEISITVSPIRGPDGIIVGASKIARDITERRRAEERQQLLLREMNHRVKNLFALSASLVSLSARQAATPAELAELVGARLSALARAHDLTLSRDSGGGPATTLHALISTILQPFESGDGEGRRVSIDGSDLALSGSAVTSLALLMHEFATNAAKYGALATQGGSIGIVIAIAGGELQLDWRECGGPAALSAAIDEGFGSVLVRATARGQLGGTVTRRFDRDGLVIRLTVPLARLGP